MLNSESDVFNRESFSAVADADSNFAAKLQGRGHIVRPGPRKVIENDACQSDFKAHATTCRKTWTSARESQVDGHQGLIDYLNGSDRDCRLGTVSD